ncbi:glycosyltransferase [Mesorhizobium sp. VK9D]|uniref:glycosyltransferase n=1 Tax=Mesorhizobium australafricanum TaxID=3072311 RepID=UPI002A23D656|nr:glycosyltransferase [Mesorhizobium sp. VK9D]MDX8456105.1 glycosyltransferase [Mesorhizobium sp. VK9D]
MDLGDFKGENMGANNPRISGFVITYNSGEILRTCLRSLRFVDELIVIDKSSTDKTPSVAAAYADKVISVPWSPLPTETRFVAYDACSHDFILYLDHDECLSVEGIHWVRENAGSHPAGVFRFPKREYILGRHDEDAYYWPSYNIRAFRRGSAEFVSTLHEEVGRIKGDVHDVPYDGGACIHNLSHRDTYQWIEKTNRYTNVQDRVSFFDTSKPLEIFAQERIEFWLAQSRSRSDYVVSAALLRAVYDIVDRVKLWEAQDGLDGNRAFAAVCAELEATYDIADRAKLWEAQGGPDGKAVFAAVRAELKASDDALRPGRRRVDMEISPRGQRSSLKAAMKRISLRIRGKKR